MKKTKKKSSKKKATKSKADKSAYFKNWYAKNKDKISERNKERYRTDPAFQEKQREAGRKRREKLRQEKAKAKLMTQRKRAEDAWKNTTFKPAKILNLGGVSRVCYSTSEFAKYLCRTTESLRRWLSEGVLPGVSFVDDAGEYWFSKEYCEAVWECIEENTLYGGSGRGNGSLDTLSELIDTKIADRGLHIYSVRK